jgi:hypothetical protein
MAKYHSATNSCDFLQESILTLRSMSFVLDLAPKEFAYVSKAIDLLRQHLEELIEEAMLDQAHRLKMHSPHSSGQLGG